MSAPAKKTPCKTRDVARPTSTVVAPGNPTSTMAASTAVKRAAAAASGTATAMSVQRVVVVVVLLWLEAWQRGAAIIVHAHIVGLPHPLFMAFQCYKFG
eukprot:m.22699 g.22699  ORF g.22699 m.22699 type:complete len:99 (-) comp6905_c0_seq2:52-348(-)